MGVVDQAYKVWYKIWVHYSKIFDRFGVQIEVYVCRIFRPSKLKEKQECCLNDTEYKAKINRVECMNASSGNIWCNSGFSHATIITRCSTHIYTWSFFLISSMHKRSCLKHLQWYRSSLYDWIVLNLIGYHSYPVEYKLNKTKKDGMHGINMDATLTRSLLNRLLQP